MRIDGTRCHILACGATAVFQCASCGRACCDSHGRTVTLERRAEQLETSGHRWMLERMPTRTETYVLCARCATRPIPVTPSLAARSTVR